MKDNALPSWDPPSLYSGIDDRRNEVPQWDFSRLIDPRPVAEGVLPPNIDGKFIPQEVPFASSYGPLGQSLGNDELSNMMLSKLIDLLGSGRIEKPSDVPFDAGKK